MDLGLTGKVAVVTGASKGIGLATALELARAGAHVVGCARGREALDEAMVACRAAAREAGTAAQALGVQADVTHRADLERLMHTAVDRFGGLDCLVNNAGEGPRGPGAATDQGWFAHVEQYLMSVVRAVESALPHLRARGAGRIVVISSVAGERPSGASPLAATKAAVNNYVRGLARDLAKEQITVNAVAPGLVWTPHRLTAPGGVGQRLAAATGLDVEEALHRYAREAIPIGRYVHPEEVAALTVYLCSTRAAPLTGAIIPIDGGAGGSLLPPEARLAS